MLKLSEILRSKSPLLILSIIICSRFYKGFDTVVSISHLCLVICISYVNVQCDKRLFEATGINVMICENEELATSSETVLAFIYPSTSLTPGWRPIRRSGGTHSSNRQLWAIISFPLTRKFQDSLWAECLIKKSKSSFMLSIKVIAQLPSPLSEQTVRGSGLTLLSLKENFSASPWKPKGKIHPYAVSDSLKHRHQKIYIGICPMIMNRPSLYSLPCDTACSRRARWTAFHAWQKPYLVPASLALRWYN